ncbi:MAG: DNA cytosine methyltransferase [Aquisalimonadaceae bacterium]
MDYQRIQGKTSVPVVDLFAGPGGLSEGFAAYSGHLGFDVRLSIEKDNAAHRTLELRSFFRQFALGDAPELYYDYIRGEKGVTRQDLLDAYPEQARAAAHIAWHSELGVAPLNQVLGRIGTAVDGAQQWVLLGGPPCQAYSVIGRARMKGSESFEGDRRHTLYQEYLKIVAAYQPTVFVMENVKGILSSRHKNSRIFQKILSDLRDPWEGLSAEERLEIPQPSTKHTYQIFSFTRPAQCEGELAPEDYVIRGERHGVPQTRHRVILLGVRSDYPGPLPLPTLTEAPHRVSVREVIGDLPSVRSLVTMGRRRISRDAEDWVAAIRNGWSESVLPQVDEENLRRQLDDAAILLEHFSDNGEPFIPGRAIPAQLSEWLSDGRLRGVIQHQARAHMPSDLQRYLYAACYAHCSGASPKIRDFPEALWPNHANVRAKDGGTDFEDRFRVQLWDKPSSTITSHIAKDGHYYIHPDPAQCRSLTVREAARLQTFPDNYFFDGNRTNAFGQIGNAVPPYLAFQLADVVAEIIDIWSAMAVPTQAVAAR